MIDIWVILTTAIAGGVLIWAGRLDERRRWKRLLHDGRLHYGRAPERDAAMHVHERQGLPESDWPA